MLMNCDSANKLVKQLQADKAAIQTKEAQNASYSYLNGETPEKPEYDFAETQAALRRYDDKIVKLKHAINVFNCTTQLDGLDMTIDAALVRMAMLNNEKTKLNSMRMSQKKSRMTTLRGVSEFTEINYAIEDAQTRYDEVSRELLAIQQALNIANLTKTFEIDIEA